MVTSNVSNASVGTEDAVASTSQDNASTRPKLWKRLANVGANIFRGITESRASRNQNLLDNVSTAPLPGEARVDQNRTQRHRNSNPLNPRRTDQASNSMQVNENSGRRTSSSTIARGNTQTEVGTPLPVRITVETSNGPQSDEASVSDCSAKSDVAVAPAPEVKAPTAKPKAADSSAFLCFAVQNLAEQTFACGEEIKEGFDNLTKNIWASDLGWNSTSRSAPPNESIEVVLKSSRHERSDRKQEISGNTKSIKNINKTAFMNKEVLNYIRTKIISVTAESYKQRDAHNKDALNLFMKNLKESAPDDELIATSKCSRKETLKLYEDFCISNGISRYSKDFKALKNQPTFPDRVHSFATTTTVHASGSLPLEDEVSSSSPEQDQKAPTASVSTGDSSTSVGRKNVPGQNFMKKVLLKALSNATNSSNEQVNIGAKSSVEGLRTTMAHVQPQTEGNDENSFTSRLQAKKTFNFSAYGVPFPSIATTLTSISEGNNDDNADISNYPDLNNTENIDEFGFPTLKADKDAGTNGALLNSYLRSVSPSPSVSSSLSPNLTPQSSPKASPKSSPKASLEASPASSPKVSPKASPEASPESSPKSSPRDSRMNSPMSSPGSIPRMSPSISPGASPSNSPTNSGMSGQSSGSASAARRSTKINAGAGKTAGVRSIRVERLWGYNAIDIVRQKVLFQMHRTEREPHLQNEDALVGFTRFLMRTHIKNLDVMVEMPAHEALKQFKAYCAAKNISPYGSEHTEI